MNGIIHLNEVVVSFDFTELSRVQRNYSEGSLSQCRRLDKSMTNLRQLVESKGKGQSIHFCASDDPIRRCSKTTENQSYDYQKRHFSQEKGEKEILVSAKSLSLIFETSICRTADLQDVYVYILLLKIAPITIITSN